MKTASEDWKQKWTPAIVGYAETLRSKSVRTALQAVQTKFTGIAVFVLIMLHSD